MKNRPALHTLVLFTIVNFDALDPDGDMEQPTENKGETLTGMMCQDVCEFDGPYYYWRNVDGSKVFDDMEVESWTAI